MLGCISLSPAALGSEGPPGLEWWNCREHQRVTRRAGWGFDSWKFETWKPGSRAALLSGAGDDARVVCVARAGGGTSVIPWHQLGPVFLPKEGCGAGLDIVDRFTQESGSPGRSRSQGKAKVKLECQPVGSRCCWSCWLTLEGQAPASLLQKAGENIDSVSQLQPACLLLWPHRKTFLLSPSLAQLCGAEPQQQ